MIRDEVLHMLLQSTGKYVSGGELARALSVSRTAVWKIVGQLREEGYAVESQPRRGYRLLPGSDVLSAEGVLRHLRRQDLRLRVYKTISSTNTALKALAAEGEEAGLVLLAEEQNAGRGRLGRSFYSPHGSGLYMSLLLRPAMPVAEATRLTVCAAVAVCETVEELSGREAQIKWVNDVFVDGRKVCGILTEASIDCENGALHYVVVGIGVNTRAPKGNYPEELRDIAGPAFGDAPIPELRCRLAAGILDRLADYAEDPAAPAIFEGYKRRSLVLGREIEILTPGKEPVPAVAVDLAEDCSLLVRLPDGSLRRLSSGEVSVKARVKSGAMVSPAGTD